MEKRRFDAVIFDLDGTLLDTLDDLADAVNYSLRQFGYPLRTTDEVRNFVGNGVKVLISRAVPEETTREAAEECLRVFAAYYRKNNTVKTVPYTGILEMLDVLCQAELKTAVVSNKIEDAVKLLCGQFFCSRIVSALGDTGVRKRKPAPDGIYAAMKELGTEAERTLYVGDSEVDLQTAQNAGITFAGVSWGFRGRSFLENAGAEFIVDTPEELLNFIGIKQI